LEGIFPFLNSAPLIISEPITTATEDQLYLYQVEASDPNGDTLTYSFTIKPEGMNINGESGLISWTPTNNQAGIHQIIVEISDGKQSVTQSFEIEVININNHPQILSYSPASINIKINEGNSVKFEVQAQDIDLNTTLSYQWLLNGKKVSSSTVSGNDSKSSWIYSAGYGDYSQKIVKILVSDGELEDYAKWNITINDITPPAQPTLNTLTSPTNISPQILSGTKETNTSIWINGIEVIPLDLLTDWSYSYNLSEGTNNISITSRDAAGNKSASITTTIILDTSAPEAPTLNTVVSPTNISPQILSGNKETNSSIWINGTEVISINSDIAWSYTFDLFEGNNSISITSRDTAGNESLPIITTVEYDPNIYINAGNTTGIEDGTKTHPFNTITEGLIAVAPGKSVVVSEGIYNEQLIINKSITLQGAEKESTIISGLEYTENLITIEADGVKISGFKIDGISATDVGVYSDSSFSIEISENIIQNQQDSGILYHSAGNDYSSGIYVYNNEICFNSKNGIKVTGEGSGIIESNTIRKNTNGIRTSNSASLEIKYNNIDDNTSAGILCQDSSFLLIWGNEITINDYGIKVGVQSSDTTNPDIGGGIEDGVGQNKIAGNKTHGVSNKTTHNIMAKNNWWGDATGPKYPYHTSSSGDWAYWSETGGDIIFNPHLTAEP
jgi:hypothetical protein